MEQLSNKELKQKTIFNEGKKIVLLAFMLLQIIFI